MIEINLARQLQPDGLGRTSGKWGYGVICTVLCLALGATSWWWTQFKQQELQSLLQEKQAYTQSSRDIQATLSRLEQYQQDKLILRTSFDEIEAHEVSSRQPMILLHGVSQSVAGLDIWLNRIQMVDQTVELRGQSVTMQEIGKYVDALENHDVITSLPSVEIIDQESQSKGADFLFVLRFTLKPKMES